MVDAIKYLGVVEGMCNADYLYKRHCPFLLCEGCEQNEDKSIENIGSLTF